MIAYRQPVTRGEISGNGVAGYTDVGRSRSGGGLPWLAIKRYRDARTIRDNDPILNDFGLKSLEELPNAEDLIVTPSEDLLDQMDYQRRNVSESSQGRL